MATGSNEKAKSTRRTASREGKSSLTNERILDAAARVLSRKGFAGTRLNEIAETAGVQAPAIYYYYSSREELLEEVIRRGQDRTHQHVAAALAEVPERTPPIDKICLAVEAHLRVVLHLSEYTRAAIRNTGQTPEDMRRRLLAGQRRYGDLWQGLFQEAEAAGELRDDLDAYAARLLVIGALNWAAEWWNSRRIPLDVVIATASSIARHGLSVQNRPIS